MQKYQGISRLLQKSSMPRPEERTLPRGRPEREGTTGREGKKAHQDLKPTDVVGPPTDDVGPPHRIQVKMAFSLEQAACGSMGFFTHRVGTKERMCRLR